MWVLQDRVRVSEYFPYTTHGGRKNKARPDALLKWAYIIVYYKLLEVFDTATSGANMDLTFGKGIEPRASRSLSECLTATEPVYDDKDVQKGNRGLVRREKRLRRIDRDVRVSVCVEQTWKPRNTRQRGNRGSKRGGGGR
ncbi:hypothetical protein ElyMa_005845200 [Elysia marginata]|uniref:PiggyBac transposable element-derived protein domain-containing protein n=1 Tax=Elysia marginata TaxID=1093978 RepID=A0AAV4FZ44_9GAST|nr:hypothetical protein ElyMa_005845200 [Elysia marginata]